MIVHAALALVVVASSVQSQAEGGVEGVVRGFDERGRFPLPAAMVEVLGQGRVFTAQADSVGVYRIPSIPPGVWRLRVTSVGFEDYETAIRISAGNVTNYGVSLLPKPVSFPEIVVMGDAARALPDSLDNTSASDFGEVAFRTLEGSSGLTESGLTEALSGLIPAEPGEDQDELLLRGSAADLKLVLLNGAPVYTPFHVGGILEPFDRALLGTGSVFVGGAPARYDGGISYILDMRTRRPAEPDRIQSTGALDMVGGRGVIEGPIGDFATFIVGGRALHEVDTGVFDTDDPPLGYRDALTTIEFDLPGDKHFSSTVFWNEESVSLEVPDPSFDSTGAFVDGGEAAWGNRALALTYASTSEDGGRTELTGALTRYEANLPFGIGGSALAQGVTRRARIGFDVDRPVLKGRVGYGALVDWIGVRYAIRSETRSELLPLEASAVVLGGYVEGAWTPSEVVHFRSGVRVDQFTGPDETRVAPRAALTMLLTEQSRLTVAVGRFNQYSRALEERESPVAGDPDGEVTGVPLLPVASASHLIVSLDQELPREIDLSLGTFRKSFKGTSGVEGERFRTTGFDFRLSRDGEVLTGWVDYSITWFWSRNLDNPRGMGFPRRQLLNAGVSGRWPGLAGLDLQMSFGSGLPFTAIPFGSETTADLPLLKSSDVSMVAPPPVNMTSGEVTTTRFFRVDARVFGVFNPTVRGRQVEIRPYVKVLNAFDGRDGLFFLSQFADGSARPLAELSFLPIVGFEWKF